jgi:hypothetical protein
VAHEWLTRGTRIPPYARNSCICRYAILRHHDAPSNRGLRPVWGRFFNDALNNAGLVLKLLLRHYPVDLVEEAFSRALEWDAAVMARVWSRTSA